MLPEKVAPRKQRVPALPPGEDVFPEGAGPAQLVAQAAELRRPDVVRRVHGGIAGGDDGHQGLLVAVVLGGIPDGERLD